VSLSDIADVDVGASGADVIDCVVCTFVPVVVVTVAIVDVSPDVASFALNPKQNHCRLLFSHFFLFLIFLR